MITRIRRLFGGLIYASYVLLAPFCYAQNQPSPPNSYQIGPYPVPFENDRIKTQFWTWLHFTPSIEGRENPTYKLVLTISIQLDNLPKLLSDYAAQTLSTDPCGRCPNVDNWVYSPLNVNPPEVKQHCLRITASGVFSTWTCLPGVDETVCDYYEDDLGNKWPYNCRLRRGDPIKSRNFQQEYELTKDYFLDVTPDGRIKWTDSGLIIHMIGDSPGSQFLEVVAMLENNLKSTIAAACSLDTKFIDMNVPEDFKVLNPKYCYGAFEKTDQGAFLIVSASVSTTEAEINNFMRKHFEGIWRGINLPPSTPQRPRDGYIRGGGSGR